MTYNEFLKLPALLEKCHNFYFFEWSKSSPDNVICKCSQCGSTLLFISYSPRYNDKFCFWTMNDRGILQVPFVITDINITNQIINCNDIMIKSIIE